ncbi:phage tail length tape measure family protein [Sphingomonas sp. PB2P19]|uniref:phage tail length tape measure family protein n=1 Tax=Sphingomonas rhamnosi TaxID=3096156 RepID=UPI002FC92765
MAAAAIGALRVTLGIDTAAFNDGLNIAQKRMTATGKNFQAIGGKIATAGAGMTAAISLPFAALVKSSIPAAVESQQALAQVTAAVASMGAASGRSVAQLQEQAGALQSLSNFDDDDILKSVTANMLTFGNVSGEAFDRAQLAAINLSARMGTDLQSAALMVGKALNDPVKGLSALGRAGIQFTADQKEQIKAMVAGGNAAGAQAIMLRELERQFGGAAKAQRDATPDAAMQEQWRTLQENIGAVALKVMPPLLSAVTSLATAFNNVDPTVQTFIIGAVAVAAALGPITVGIGGMVSAFGLVLPALAPVATFLTAVLIPAAIATAPVWAPIALAVGAAAGAFALLVKYQPQIDAFGVAVVTRMKALYDGVKTWLFDKLNVIFDSVRAKVSGVGDAFYKLWDRVVGHSYVPDMVDAISNHFERLDDVMVNPASEAAAATADAFKYMGEGINRSLANSIVNMRGAKDILKGVLSEISRALEEVLVQKMGGGTGGLGGAIGKILGGILGGQTGSQSVDMSGWGDPGTIPMDTTGSGVQLPGFATGGSFQVRGMSGADKNILQLNGQPIARVSHGETVGIGRGGSVPNVTQHITIPGGVDLMTRTEGYRVAGAVKDATMMAIADQQRRRG